MADDKRPPYRYQPLASNEIRLATLVGRSEETGLELSLQTVNLDKPGRYVALSYTWGDPFHDGPNIEDLYKSTGSERCRKVSCDGGTLLVTNNLVSALSTLPLQDDGRQECLSRYDGIWIDAISINQEDMAEREQQVALMHLIYRRSAVVWIWLGPAIPDISSLNAISQKLYSVTEPSKDPESFQMTEDELLTDGDLRTLLALCLCKWFRRQWIAQEAAEPDRAVFFLGDEEIQWEDMRPVTTELQDTEVLSRIEELVASPEYGDLALRHVDAYGSSLSIAAVTTIRDHITEAETAGTMPRISVSVANMTQLSCSVPHDKIYAIPRLFDERYGYSKHITPDYSEPVRGLYIRAVKAIFAEENSLSLLSHVADPTERPLDGSPSWLLGLGAYPLTAGSFRNNSAGRFSCISGFELYGEAQQRGQVDLSPDPQLRVRAHRLGNVAYKTPTGEGPLGILKLLAKMAPAYTTGHTRSEALWRTLVEDYSISEEGPASPDLGHVLPLWLAFLHLRLSPGSRAKSLALLAALRAQPGIDPLHIPTADFVEEVRQAFRGYGFVPRSVFGMWRTMTLNEVGPGGPLFEPDMDVLVEDFDQSVSSHMPSTLFLTEGGHLGLGPPSLDVGDVVALLPGAEMPFTLRDSGSGMEGGQACFEVIGETYVHDAMFGDAVDGSVVLEDIVLE